MFFFFFISCLRLLAYVGDGLRPRSISKKCPTPFPGHWNQQRTLEIMTSVLSKEGKEFESQKSLEMCIPVERLVS